MIRNAEIKITTDTTGFIEDITKARQAVDALRKSLEDLNKIGITVGTEVGVDFSSQKDITVWVVKDVFNNNVLFLTTDYEEAISLEKRLELGISRVLVEEFPLHVK